MYDAIAEEKKANAEVNSKLSKIPKSRPANKRIVRK